MRYLLISIILLASSLPVLTQTSTDRPAELPPGSVKVSKKQVDNAETRFLTALYGTVRYPNVARENGVAGGVLVSLQIDSTGHLTVNEANFHAPEALATLTAQLVDNEVIRVVGYQSRGGISPLTTDSQLRQQAEAALLQEVIRTFNTMPAFTPATRDGQPTTSTQTRLIVFRLE